MTPSPAQSYREIPLTQGQVALVSAHRFEAVSKFKWHAHWNPKIKGFYAMHKSSRTKGGHVVYMSRFIMGLERGDKQDG